MSKTWQTKQHQDIYIRRVELLVSLVLQVGVLLSSTVIFIGLVLFFVHAKSGPYKLFTTTHYAFPHSIRELTLSLKAKSGIGFIELGVLLLILTPITRVAVSILSFLIIRDKLMTLITLFVLIVLISSFWLGMAVR
jgi:uncharacterized membrane protein